MRSRVNDLKAILRDYGKEPEKEKKKAGGKFIKRLFLFIIAHIIPIIIGCIIITVIFLVIFPAFFFIQEFFGGGESGTYNPTDINGTDYKQYFSSDFLDIPYGVPTERGIITWGVDDGQWLYGIKPYAGHTGIDIARTYSDKISGYSPHILGTHRGVLIRSETFTTDPADPRYYIYNRRSYVDGSTIDTSSRVTISNSKKSKPYGQHVVVGSLDGRFYTLYGHMYAVNSNILNKTMLERGDDLGIMGNTGNSFGIHLHYEVRYCGTNNEDHHKLPNQCKIYNPLSQNPELGNNYLGFNPNMNARMVSAGADDIKENINMSIDENLVFKNKYNEICGGIKLYLVNKKIDCKTVFPILYQNRNNELFPVNLQEEDMIKNGKLYIQKEYTLNPELLTVMEITQISGLENIKLASFSSEELIKQLGQKYSHGKFVNPEKKYRSALMGKSNSEMENEMAQDVIETLNSYAKNGLTTEKIYQKYYNSTLYKDPKQNPFIYNMTNKNNLFMYFRDKTGAITGLYKEEGVMALYDKIKGF